MPPEARSRITTAVELSPDRRCVTIRRDDGGAMLAEIERLIGGATRAESHMAENHRVLAEQERELGYLRSVVEEQAAKIGELTGDLIDERQVCKAAVLEMSSRLNDTIRVPKADLFASLPVLWMSWALLPVTGFAAYLAPHLHHG